MRATKRLPDGYKVSNELNYRYNVAYRKAVRPIAILLLFVYAWGFSITARLLRQDVPPFFESWPTMVIMWLLAMQLARIFHEGIHGAGLWLLTGVRPESEFSFENTYAVAPGWYLPYSAYLLVALAPLVGLTVIGFLLIPWVPNAVFFLTLAIITLNASWSTADVYLAGWTLAKSRADALVMYTQDWVRIYNRLDPIEGGGGCMNQAIIHTYTLEGLTLQTGDLICTTDGKDDILPGQFWRLVGKLVPGDVDHVIVYVGPEGRCIEAGALGVIAFDIPDGRWQVEALAQRRGMLFDTLWGVAYPLAERGLAPDAETLIRRQVADYCLMQAQARKPYNVNFFDSQTEQAFYCSQLAYKAYLPHGIDLNSGLGVPNLPGGEAIVFPQEIWAACVHQRFA